MRYLTLNLSLLSLLAVILFAAACSSGSGPATIPTAGNTSVAAASASGNYIVGLVPGATAQDVSALSGGLANRPEHSYSHALTGFAGTLSPGEVQQLKTDPRVAFVELDLAIQIAKGKPPGNPGGGGGGGGGGGQELPWGVDRIDAELNSGDGGGIGVVVFDTGIQLDHPDLPGVVDGYNVFNTSKEAKDDNGHGTHVAGTIAAADNSVGVVGVAPGATLIAVKVLNRRGSGSIGGLVAGIDWAITNKAAHNIRVANMSLTALGTSTALQGAITNAVNAGITFACAAGNDTANAASYIPASYSNVICVSALNSNNTFASYSNYGGVVDIIAPGTSIPSTWKGSGYKTISGTSMASPHVAGAAALWLDNHAGDTPAQVAAALTSATFSESAPAGGWVGDPDGTPEPLVDAENL